MKNHFNHYHIAVFLSTGSVIFGIIREFLIVALLGFTAHNDYLQLYLSIFYTIGLSIDAVRLACLNLYTSLTLSQLLFCASLVALPFSILVGISMSYTTKILDPFLLFITISGSFLNLIASLLITYCQRHNLFLIAQIINVIPNFILIPGIVIAWSIKTHFAFAMICFTSFIPVAQCSFLLFILRKQFAITPTHSLSLFASVLSFLRHFCAIMGDQFFQIIIRSVFFHYQAGFLSLYAIMIRIYASMKFILIDSFIGSKLAHWHHEISQPDFFSKLIQSTTLPCFILMIGLLISLNLHSHLVVATLQIGFILLLGFYLSTLVRIVYFKINHQQNNPGLVLKFALYEILCALTAFMMMKELSHPVLEILWLGYIAKPFAQLFFLRKREQKIQFKEKYI